MDSSSGSSSSSSYREEYWLLKKQYDEVLESNAHMVLRLEEAKLMLFKNTKELQSQISALMRENMSLRAQKEYLHQGLGKLRSLVGNLKEEQSRSVARQTGFLDELVCLVKSVAENKDNDLVCPETEASPGKENAPFLNPAALRELDKQLRANTVGSYYLPAIEEENSGHVENDDKSLNTTRMLSPSTTNEQSHEMQQKTWRGNSKPKVRTLKIRRRGSTNRLKKDAVRNKVLPQNRYNMGDTQHLQNITDVSLQPMADRAASIVDSTSDEENKKKPITAIASSSSMMARMEANTSGMSELEDSNRNGVQKQQEKIYNRKSHPSNNEVSTTVSCKSKDMDLQNPNLKTVCPQGANKGKQLLAQDVPQQTPNVIFMKNVFKSYRAGDKEEIISTLRHSNNCKGKSISSESESMQVETKIQEESITEKIEKLDCHVELVDLFNSAQPDHLHEIRRIPQMQTEATESLQRSIIGEEIIRPRKVLNKLGKENPTNESQRSSKMLTAQSTSCDMIKKSLNCQYSANFGPRTREAQSYQTTAHSSEASLAGLENWKSNLRKNQSMQGDTTISKIEELINFEETHDQPNEVRASLIRSPKNMWTRESRASCMTKGAIMKTSLNNEGVKAKDAAAIQEIESCQTTAIPKILQARTSTEPPHRQNEIPATTRHSGNKESMQMKVLSVQGDDFILERDAKSIKIVENQAERGKLASGSPNSKNTPTAQTSTCRNTKDALLKTVPNCKETKAKAASIMPDLTSSSEIKTSEIPPPKEHNDSSKEQTGIPELASCLVDQERKPRKTHIRGDANPTGNKPQQALLPIGRKSKSTKTRSLTHSVLFTPVKDFFKSEVENTPESDVSLNLAISPEEDDSETRSRRHGTFGQTKPCFLSPSMEDFRVATGRILRESQLANSLLKDMRVSAASIQGDSSYSNSATPKRGKRLRPYSSRNKELAALLAESVGFTRELGSEVMPERGIVTRARSKPRRTQEVMYNFSSPSGTDEPETDPEFKPPSRWLRRRARK